MDLKGSLIDTSLKIYPSKRLFKFLKTLPTDNDVKIPINILKLIKDEHELKNSKQDIDIKPVEIQLNNKDIENLKAIKEIFNTMENDRTVKKESADTKEEKLIEDKIFNENIEDKENTKESARNKITDCYLTTSDIDWLYVYLQKLKIKNKGVPYLHVLLEGVHIEMPENKIIKRNPVLEARCVKLRAQQEAREYRKMTKSVDNVRMRFPEDSIAYQLKHLNRQLIAIGQFIISIFAGFLFGFRGVEWMVGNLDFGFRLLLGVMCALVIALAEIYFLAKKLNEELNIPETVQLGGPNKFVNETSHGLNDKNTSETINKEHQD